MEQDRRKARGRTSRVKSDESENHEKSPRRTSLLSILCPGNGGVVLRIVSSHPKLEVVNMEKNVRLYGIPKLPKEANEMVSAYLGLTNPCHIACFERINGDFLVIVREILKRKYECERFNDFVKSTLDS